MLGINYEGALSSEVLEPVPGFTEEPVLDQEGGAEHDGALDRHGAEVLPHHVPAEGVLESILTWQRREQTGDSEPNPPGKVSLALDAAPDLTVNASLLPDSIGSGAFRCFNVPPRAWKSKMADSSGGRGCRRRRLFWLMTA